MKSLLHDVRYAVRTLGRRPGYAAATLLTLVLGIGATTAVFSVVNGVLLQPLPHPNPEQLALVYEVDERPGFFEDHNPVTTANYRDWRDLNRSFTGMAAFQSYQVTYRGTAEPRRVQAGFPTADFFSLLGVKPILGRTFVPQEDVPGNDGVAVIGHRFWLTEFGGDSAVIGRSLTVGSSQLEIVGVLPADFRFLDQEYAIWSPLALNKERFTDRKSHTLHVMGRLKPGVDLATAQADLDRVVAGLRDQYPEFLTGYAVNVVSMTDEVVGRIRPALLVLLGAVGLVLLIAAVNVANLMLTRTAAQSREVAIRSALGAGRGRLIRNKIVESGVLAVVGGALGVVAAAGTTTLLLAIAPDTLPHVENIGMDWRVLGFAVLAALVAGTVFTVAPAAVVARAQVVTGLKDGGRGSTVSRGHRRLRAGFVVVQLAFSAMLLVSAGLVLSSFARLMHVDPGFEPGGVTTMKLVLSGSQFSGVGNQVPVHERILQAVRQVPDVESAGMTRFLPMDEGEWTWSVQIRGKPERVDGEKRDYGYHTVDTDYFRTMGMTLIRGRQFAESDRMGAPCVVIVSESFVRRFFDEGEDPIGRVMYLLSRPDEGLEIVGVVEDVHLLSLDREPQPAYYIPFRQIPFDFFLNEMSLAVRTEGDPVAIVPTVRRAITDVEPDVVVSDVMTMKERVAGSVARTRFAMTLLAVFAGVAMTLAAVGIYGVIAYAVGQRRQEIGVRLALGAAPNRIVGQFVGSGLKLIAAGLVIGLAAASGLARFQASLLFGVAPWDPGTYLAVTMLLAAVAAVAVYVPSRRASRVDPIAVLRDE